MRTTRICIASASETILGNGQLKIGKKTSLCFFFPIFNGLIFGQAMPTVASDSYRFLSTDGKRDYLSEM